jgi:hypothetical protein
MTVAMRQVGGVHILDFSDDLCAKFGDIRQGRHGNNGASELHQVIKGLNLGENSLVLFNFSGLESSEKSHSGRMVDSSFIGELVTQHVGIKKNKGILAIWGTGKRLTSMLQLLNLDKELYVLPGRQFPGESFTTEPDAIRKLHELAAAGQEPAPMPPVVLQQCAASSTVSSSLVHR